MSLLPERMSFRGTLNSSRDFLGYSSYSTGDNARRNSTRCLHAERSIRSFCIYPLSAPLRPLREKLSRRWRRASSLHSRKVYTHTNKKKTVVHKVSKAMGKYVYMHKLLRRDVDHAWYSVIQEGLSSDFFLHRPLPLSLSLNLSV